jgi:phage tail-like protein
MRPDGATFWRLGGLNGWQTRTASADLAVSDRHGLQLAAADGGPLSLRSSDESFGGLTFPRGMALDSTNALVLLAPDGSWIKRFDGETRSFKTLPEIGREGTEPRRFRDARNIAIAREWLYVADAGNHRVQVFDLRTLVLIEMLNVAGWHPVDVASHKGAVYILDANRARVFRHTPYGRFELELERQDRAGEWSRIAVDRNGTLYLLNTADPEKPFLERRNPKAPAITDPGAIRDLFDAPAIRMDQEKRFCLPASLAQVCGRALPAVAPPPEVQLSKCIPSRCATNEETKGMTVAAQGNWLLYVANRKERRLDAYTGGGRRLRHSWRRDWQPVDVAACGDAAFVLDEEHQTVYRHTAGREWLTMLLRDTTGRRQWSKIACDTTAIYLYAPDGKSVQVFDCNGTERGERPYAALASLFTAKRPDPPAPLDNGLFFDRNGNGIAAVDFSEPSGARFYKEGGQWQSGPLDSKKYRCQWHRIELNLTAFPPGSRLHVSTCAHEEESDVQDPMKSQFIGAQTVVAPIGDPLQHCDFLVQSGVGRFLSLRVRLESDGFSTPVVDSAKIHYPRESYLQYLPATYSSDDEGRVFLERFLAIFQTEWDAFDRTIDEEERFFDPDSVPAGPFLEYLARQWLALPLEGDWNDEQKRRLLSAAPKLYPHRGQLAGLRDFISVYLANMAGLETEDIRTMGFPAIVEGFRERTHLFASSGSAARLGFGAPLWSATVKRRLQLGVYSQEGEAELVSAGDPEHDLFAQYAHRFRLSVPAGWVRTAAQERMLRRALDAEKPAHTQYDLCLVESRFRLDAQSTVGVDTIIGAAPSLRLGCTDCTDVPPSLPPHGRLGYDTVLASQGDRDEHRLR